MSRTARRNPPPRRGSVRMTNVRGKRGVDMTGKERREAAREIADV